MTGPRLFYVLGFENVCPDCLPKALALCAIVAAQLRVIEETIFADIQREFTDEERRFILFGVAQGFMAGLSGANFPKPFNHSQN